MPVFALSKELIFPPPHLSDDGGLLAIGGDLEPARLLLAYRMGIFPWYGPGSPILWHSPDPRMVLLTDEIHVGRSLRKRLRKNPYRVRMDGNFRAVIERCAEVERPGQDGTWIVPEMIDAYEELFELGYAHCVETLDGDQLVGGVYGVSLGGAFFGESMFATSSDASKIAFVYLVTQLERWDIRLIDCQVYTEHLDRFGAREVPRTRFLDLLNEAMKKETRRGRWSLDDDLWSE